MRTKILDAARALFVEHGYEAVTMRKIAEKIEYTATALYGHFEDKETLLRAICDVDFLAIRGAFERLGKVTDPIERLRKIGVAYVDFAVEFPNHYRLMFMTPHPRKDPALSAVKQGDPDQDAYAFVRATVAEARQAGRFREEFVDDDLLAQLVWSGVHGVVALHLTKGDDPWLTWRPVKKTAKIMVDTMIRGLLRTEGPDDGRPRA
jgi:AcrR family transcriptional regulator